MRSLCVTCCLGAALACASVAPPRAPTSTDAGPRPSCATAACHAEDAELASARGIIDVAAAALGRAYTLAADDDSFTAWTSALRDSGQYRRLDQALASARASGRHAAVLAAFDAQTLWVGERLVGVYRRTSERDVPAVIELRELGPEPALDGLRALEVSGDGRLLIVAFDDRVELREAAPGVALAASVELFPDGAWLARSPAGAIDGRAREHLVSVVDGPDEPEIFTSNLAWDRFAVRGLLALLLDGFEVYPPLSDHS